MLQVALLGGSSITDEATGTVQPVSARGLALLGHLAVHPGRPLSRQRVAELFWPDSGTAQALTNLRRELHHLRQLLGPHAGLLAGTGTELCWQDRDGVRVDVRRFATEAAAARAGAAGDRGAAAAHAGAALDAYAGPFLPGLDDEWVRTARAALEAECVELCDLACAGRRRTGDLAGAIEVMRRRIALRPLEEIGYRTLIEVQGDAGDRAAAVTTYHLCASVLEQELGVLPGRAVEEALHRLMSPREAHAVTAGAHRAAPPRSGPATPALVGRARELTVLQQLWQDAARGRPRVALLRGGAGVGKSRVMSEFGAAVARSGGVAAASRCFAASGRLRLAPLVDWLRHPAVQRAAATLEPARRAEVERLLHAGNGTAARAGARAKADAWQRHRFFEGLAAALLGTGRPLLLALDDVQWCDQETLAFVRFLLGVARHPRVLVVTTMREAAPDAVPELNSWLDELRSDATLTELAVAPLDATGTARLARAVTGSALPIGTAELVHAATGGFPLYVIEAARALVEAGSAAEPVGELSAVLLSRLAQSSEAARELAGLAAAVGTGWTIDLLAEASDLGLDSVVAAVDELWRRRIIREFGTGYDFSHDLLRETAYAQISPPRRWLLHRRVAQGLELLHADDLDAVSAQLAEQYARGGYPQRAITHARRAAELAAGVFAYAEAVRLHERTLDIIRTLPAGAGRDRQELATLEAMAAPVNAQWGYASPQLQRTLERALQLAEALDARMSVLDALAGLWTSQFVQGRPAEGYRSAQRALHLADPDSDATAAAHFAIGGSALSLGRPAEGLHHLARAARLGSRGVSLSVGTRPDVHATAWLAHAHWLLGAEEQALARCREAVRLARRIEHPFSLAVALGYGAITYQMSGDRDELAAVVDELGELCGRYAIAYYREWAAVLRGWLDDPATGVTTIFAAIEKLRATGSFARMPYWLQLAADAHDRAGRPDTARATLDAAVATAHAHDDVWWLPEVLRRRAAYDDPATARERLRDAAALAAGHGSVALLRRCEQDLDRCDLRGSSRH